MDGECASVVAPLGAMQLFLEEYYAAGIRALLVDADRRVCSLEIDMHELLEFNYELALSVLDSPTRHLGLFNRACVAAQRALLRRSEERYTVKEHAQVRIAHLPNHPALQRSRIPGSRDVGRLLSLTGTAIRTGLVKMMETHRWFLCTQCRGTFRVEADVSRYNHIPKPMRCLARGSGAVGCESANFVPVDPAMGDSAGRCVDYQEIRLQEQMARTAPAAVPREIAVVLERDLVDRVKSGDVVTVTGIVMCRWRPAVSEGRPDISVAIRASSVSAHGDQMAQRAVTGARRAEFGRFWAEHESAAMRARDTIIASMCPQIYGLFYVKLAVLLVVIGGVACTDAAGMRVRGEAHLLMVGDPGTAKSQLLRYAARLAPRAVLATGVGSTNAGLTAAAIKERGEWQLEAGALVLADRGLCCIDEFGSIRGAERNAVLEAMEQQSVSVAKAGMVCRLNARCTVLAATNSQNGSLAAGNAGLPAPLLSRFDLVLKLVDTHDEQWDARVSSFLLGNGGLGLTDNIQLPSNMWAFDKLQAYVAYVRAAFRPRISRAGEQVLVRYYQRQRQHDRHSAARTTVRLLESLIRVAQAHARLMFRGKVLVADAVVAVVLMEATMQTGSVLGAADALHTTAPADSDLFYAELEALVLRRLDLAHLG